jgi:hypothetical protein
MHRWCYAGGFLTTEDTEGSSGRARRSPCTLGSENSHSPPSHDRGAPNGSSTRSPGKLQLPRRASSEALQQLEEVMK